MVALQWFLVIFENQFVAVGHQYLEEEKTKESTINHLLPPGNYWDFTFSPLELVF